MKLLVITQYFWPEAFRINEVVTKLCARGHEVTVLTGIPNYPTGRFFEGYGLFLNRHQFHGKAKVLRVPLFPRGRGTGWRLALNYVSFAVSASIFGLALYRERFDIILVYEPSPVTVGIPAILFRRIKHVAVLFWVQDLWPESLEATGAVTSTTVLSAVASLVRFIYRRCDLVLVSSRTFLRQIRDLGIDINHGYRYFPNSAEGLYLPLSPSAASPEEKRLPRGFRVMFAGNIGTAQDFSTIIAAAELLRNEVDIHWVILGEGRQKHWVEEQVIARGLRPTFHLLGQFPVEDMPAYFSLADVLLVSLKKEPIFALTIPSKLQSYLACGRPIIAALDGEGARIVEEAGAGLTCPAGNPVALAGVVLKMRNMEPELRVRMGTSGREYFCREFDSEMLLGRLEEWMKEVA